MNGQSVAATIYSFTFMNIAKSLFHKYEDNPYKRIGLTDGYLYNDFIQILFKDVSINGSASKYTKICENAYPEYKGGNVCAYNVARSFSEAKQFLESEVSKNSADW